jgi:vacuolar-type H+-ATPase subunit E/Vma4
MELKVALDWQIISANLRKDLKNVSHNPDLKKMLQNIEDMVTELSRSEVIARQTKRTSMLASQIEKINKSINHLQKLILIAQIMN